MADNFEQVHVQLVKAESLGRTRMRGSGARSLRGCIFFGGPREPPANTGTEGRCGAVLLRRGLPTRGFGR